LEFLSHADEQVVLDITTVGEPDPKRAGISDPGTHSPTTSLPLMRRRASTLAGAKTAVFVGDKRFDVPVKIRSGPFVAHEGYFTEGHTFGAVSAGTISYRVTARPARVAIGEQWVFESDGRTMIYRIEHSDPGGKLRIAREDTGETIEAFATGEGLRAVRMVKRAVAGPEGGLDLAFAAAERFELAMDDDRIVSGTVEVKRQAGATVIVLSPTQPDWAIPRQVNVACLRDGDL